MYALGLMYENGNGVRNDPAEGLRWYRKAAEQGQPMAQNRLGECYHLGNGVPKDLREAVRLFGQAADQGNADAQRNLGACYENGLGVDRDEREAVKWYRKSAEVGNLLAQVNLGWCHETGKGVAKDPRAAVKWYRQAAEQGNGWGQQNLGLCYENGKGVAKDVVEAVRWYRKAADQGYALAQNNLGNCYANGQGVAKDFDEARNWFRKAADQGNALAQDNLARGALPKLGSWELTLKSPSGKDDFKATVTFVRRDWDRIFGVMEWRSDGPSKTLEIFSATIDPSNGAVRFDGREEYTQADGVFPGCYQGTLSADGRELSDFRGIGFASTDVTGNMKWMKEQVPSYPPAIRASLNLSEERSLLYQQFSANYVLQGISVRHGPDRPLIKELSRSKDKHVRELADLKIAFQEMYEQSMAKDAKEAEAWAKDDLDRRAKIFKFIAEAFTEENPSEKTHNPVAALMNSVGLKKAFDRRRSAVELACVQMAVMNHVRSDVSADYRARNRGKQTIERGKLTAGFKVNVAGRGVVTLQNNTGGELHNSFVATQMTVDQKKVDQYQRESEGKGKVAGLLALAFGIDPKIVKSIDNSEEVFYRYHRLEKGLPVFIPLWPKGAVIEVEVGIADDIRLLAASVGAWVGSDEGAAEISLDLNAVKRMIPSRPR